MKFYETEQRPQQVLKKTTCDLCREEIKNDKSYYDERATVDFREGTIYPEGGSGIEINIDICSKCFKERLVPFVESFGTKIEVREWDY